MTSGSKLAYMCILSGFLFSTSPALYAGGEVSSDTVRGTVRFEMRGFDMAHTTTTSLSPLDSLGRVIREADDPLLRITSVRITGWASPEGNTDENRALSVRRAATAWALVKDTLPVDGAEATVSGAGQDWDGLLDYLDARPDDGDYAAAARIIRDTPVWIVEGGRIVGSRKAALMYLGFGRVWERMKAEVFPLLRRADIEVSYECSPSSALAGGEVIPSGCPGEEWMEGFAAGRASVLEEGIRAGGDTLGGTVASSRDSAPALVKECPATETPAERKTRSRRLRAAADTAGRRPLLAVGTNVLYDFLLMPSVNIEVPIRNRVSLYADHVFPWWVFRNNASCVQNLHTKGGVRVWLGDRTQKRTLEGWWVGLNGGAATGDFEPDGKGYQWQAFGTSFEGGYQFAFGRAWRLGLGLDLGYYRYRYDRYEGFHNHRYLVWKESGAGNWFGPTALHFDLKYLIYYRTRRAAR